MMHVFMQYVPMLVIGLIVGISVSVRAVWMRARKAKAERTRLS